VVEAPGGGPNQPRGDAREIVGRGRRSLEVAPVLLDGFDAGQEGALDVVDEAWEKVRTLGLQPVNGAYVVPMGRRVGYEGGVVGAQTGKQACENVLLVVINEGIDAGKKVADVITAYPIR
jgi:hypothetical protein